MIPNGTFTIWLNHEDPPDSIQKCIASQKSRVLTLSDCPDDSSYLRKCIDASAWVRAADYLRIRHLHDHGGIYLDADVELFGAFDHFLASRMFVFRDEPGFLWNGCIGSEPNHPFLRYYLNTVERNFRHDSNVFESGMLFFTEAYYIADRGALGMAIYDWEGTKPLLNHLGFKSWLRA
jgi:mannosyltransferase OCH1-like enzyme